MNNPPSIKASSAADVNPCCRRVWPARYTGASEGTSVVRHVGSDRQGSRDPGLCVEALHTAAEWVTVCLCVCLGSSSLHTSFPTQCPLQGTPEPGILPAHTLTMSPALVTADDSVFLGIKCCLTWLRGHMLSRFPASLTGSSSPFTLLVFPSLPDFWILQCLRGSQAQSLDLFPLSRVTPLVNLPRSQSQGYPIIFYITLPYISYPIIYLSHPIYHLSSIYIYLSVIHLSSTYLSSIYLIIIISVYLSRFVLRNWLI